MSVNNDHENETKGLESEFINKLNISDKDSNLIAINCSYCIKPFNEELWCKKCDPQDDGWKKLEPKAMKIVLKRLNGSQNISAEYLNEVNLILIFIYIYYFFYII